MTCHAVREVIACHTDLLTLEIFASFLMDAGTRDEEAGLPAIPRAQRPRSSVPTLLFMSFMFFMLTSHNGDEFLARHQYQEALQSLTYQLSNYSAWMNGTISNFTLVRLIHCEVLVGELTCPSSPRQIRPCLHYLTLSISKADH